MPFESEAQRRFMYSQHPKLAKEFEAATPDNAKLPEHKKKMAEGGEVEGDEIEMPKKEFVEEHENLIKNLQPAVDEQKKQAEELKEVQGHAHGGMVSDQDKRNAIYKAMGMGKFAMGGTVPTPDIPGLQIPDRNDPNFWQSIQNALTKVSAPIARPIGAIANAAEGTANAVAPAIRAAAPAAVEATNNLTGLNLPVPSAPAAPAPDLSAPPTPLKTPTPPPTPQMPTPTVSVPGKQTGTPEKQPTVPDLFHQDTSKLTEGSNPEDRQAVVQNLANKQGGIGSIIAQAVAGLGDALSAKAGGHQEALKGLLTMQKQQRDEALANFDKQRQMRLEKLDLQTKMGDNAIKQLAAEDAYGVDESLNKQLGAPPGTKHKDLPLYMQLMTAKAAKAEKDADLHMKATKQAADEADAAEKGAGFFHFKASPEKRRAVIEARANEIIHGAKGHVKFQPSGGQEAFWTTAENAKKAMQRDPQGQIIQ